MTVDECYQLFKLKVYKEYNDVDPENEYDWNDIAYGFFLAHRFLPKEARQFSINWHHYI